MENQNRRQFIKTTGTALLVTSGISVFGLFTAAAKPKSENEQNPDEYFSDGYYNDGYSTGINPTTPDSLLLTVFPNPSDGNFNLEVNAKASVKSDVYIQDLSGKTLVYKNYDLQQGANHISFESDTLARGVYLLSVVTTKGSNSLRLVIVK